LFNGHKGDGECDSELIENNGKGDRESGKRERIAGKGQHLVLRESMCLVREN